VLGPARDWDVFQIELLDPVIAARPDDPALRAIKTKARAKGRASYRAVRKGLDRADYTQFALRFGQWVEARAWHADADAKMIARRAWSIEDFARKTLKRRQKKVLAAGKEFSRLTSEQRHDLRIALKKLRYAAEFFAPLFNKKALKPLLTSAKKLQNDLGHLNDVAVAEGLLDEFPARSGKHDISKAAGIVIGWHLNNGVNVERKLLETWEIFADQPMFSVR
jgi:CHAD domain-containing protein